MGDRKMEDKKQVNAMGANVKSGRCRSTGRLAPFPQNGYLIHERLSPVA